MGGQSAKKNNASRRGLERTPIDPLDQVYLHWNGKKYKILNLHANGALIEFSGRTSTEAPPGMGSVLKEVEITFLGNSVASFDTATVCHLDSNPVGKVTVMGLYFLNQPHGHPTSEHTMHLEMRQRERVRLLEHFRPHAVAKHPFQYDTELFFHIENLSSQGACLLTSKRNRLLFKGCKLLPLSLYLHDSKNIPVRATIQYIQPAIGTDLIQLGVQFESKIGEKQQEAMVRFLLSFGEFAGTNPMDKLRAAGFRPKYIKSEITFAPTHTVDEYHQVLELRKRAYAAAKKIDESLRADEMADIFDLNSKIIVAKHRDQVVGSIRLTTCRWNTDRFELESSITIPSHFNRATTTEISRLCVDPTYAKSDLVLGLIERATEFCAKAGMTHVITSCVEEMLGYYKKLAFYPTGLKFELKTLQGLPHWFLVHDCNHHRMVRNINPIYWHFAYRKMLEHLKTFKTLENYVQLGVIRRWWLHFFIKIALKCLGIFRRTKN